MSKKATMLSFFIIAAVLQIVWGLVPSASKYVIDEIPVELYITLRWTISGMIFCLYLSLMRSWKKIALQDFFAVMLLGILGYGVASFGTLYGLKIGGVSHFALMSAVGPVISSIMSIIFLKERPQRVFFLALPLAVIGLLIVVWGKYQISNLEIAGWSALYVMAAFTLEALIFVKSKTYQAYMSLPQYLAIAQISAAVWMWIMQIGYFHHTALVSQMTVRGWSSLLFVALIACVLCYAILYWLLNYVEGHRLAIFDGLHVVSAAVCGALLFQEQLNTSMIMGGFSILAAIGLVTISRSKSHGVT